MTTDIYRGAIGGSRDDLDIALRVIGRRDESLDCASVLLTRPRVLSFEGGDWLDIRFLEPELAVGRTFSFASAPTEPDLRILFRRGRTLFKRRLEEAEAGETILITQYGTNGFRLDRDRPAVFIAGGVGIAPFRSMIKDVIDHADNIPITVIHVTRTRDAPFRTELLAWSADHAQLDIHHIETITTGRLTAARLGRLISAPIRTDPTFYVAGPPGMVAAAAQLLARLGVDDNVIKTDSFAGY